ncbi:MULTISPECIES: hypothetical protein [unclassified Modestobacter]|uniref:hypothetical protein n=1 Tax=unclassified Modestobacter TaxID=2643866 RepID=UPI0022AB0989|nr:MULTISPECIES: hypothetical protein [unclassified Modestobacter]MCZ2823773.1 hypothetical protein [Modestobacter sp. VKM Ac-2981]MCZ2852018.1 hypothetical protein [Modestobacter sp. VKM Ac-2982]
MALRGGSVAALPAASGGQRCYNRMFGGQVAGPVDTAALLVFLSDSIQQVIAPLLAGSATGSTLHARPAGAPIRELT